MDFKIGDEIVEENQEPTKKNNKISMIIIISLSIIVGLTVFFISNAIFGVKKVEPVDTSTNVRLTDENVQILYDYVTYGTKGIRNDKFIKESSVKKEDFNNYEKFYYALQFAQVEDFENTGKVNNENQKIYNISSAKIKTYMQRFFGNEVTYSTNSTITYPFSFRINNQNVGTLTYAIERKGFDTVFTGLEENEVKKDLVEPYYTKLTKATKKSDGSLELIEKIIYTKLVPRDNVYDVYIYKDYQNTILLETKSNLTKEQLEANPISITDYLEKASTISYLFKLNSTNYYFYSSTIN